jgi:RNA 2',3'-cyclic 3'-phosphodiesterase
MASSVRAFFALDLDAAARDRVVDLMERLRREVAGVRWVRPEGLHLTVRFLGWTDEARLARIEEALAAPARACPPAEVPLGGLGLFPARGAPRVLWVGLTLPEPMHALQRACEEAARNERFEPEERPFHPHLTLGRWKDRAPRPTLSAVDLGTARIDQLTLCRSDLRPDGAVYTPLRVFDLGR